MPQAAMTKAEGVRAWMVWCPECLPAGLLRGPVEVDRRLQRGSSAGVKAPVSVLSTGGGPGRDTSG